MVRRRRQSWGPALGWMKDFGFTESPSPPCRPSLSGPAHVTRERESCPGMGGEFGASQQSVGTATAPWHTPQAHAQRSSCLLEAKGQVSLVFVPFTAFSSPVIFLKHPDGSMWRPAVSLFFDKPQTLLYLSSRRKDWKCSSLIFQSPQHVYAVPGGEAGWQFVLIVWPHFRKRLFESEHLGRKWRSVAVWKSNWC